MPALHALQTLPEIKQVSWLHPQPLRHLFERFKRWHISAPLDQAEKTHRNIQQLREPLLSDSLLAANPKYPLAKPLA